MDDMKNEPAFVSTLGDTNSNDPHSESNQERPESIGPADGTGRRMADRLREKGYHPVIIFGASLSGKSTLLSSLFGYLKRLCHR